MARIDEINAELDMLDLSIAAATEALKKHNEKVRKSVLGKIIRFFTAPYRMFKKQWEKGNVLGIIATGILAIIATLTLICPIMAFVGEIKKMNDDDKRIVLENKQSALIARKSELQAEEQMIIEHDSTELNEEEKQELTKQNFEKNYKAVKYQHMESQEIEESVETLKLTK